MLIYGADRLRKSKTVNNITMQYVWDRGNLAAEISGSTIGSIYNYGPDGIMSKEARNGDKTLYLKNAHGDVVGISGMSGNVFENYRYDAFGNVLSDSEPDRFGYCGEFLDSESGLIYLRNRYYDTATGRFITEDPVKDGKNWYSYCNANPVMLVDPMGLWGDLVHVEATKWIFAEMGLNSYHAEIVAEANISVDKGDMAATNYDNVAQSRHFDRNPDPNIDSREVWAEACLNDAIYTWNNADDLYYNGEITFEERHEMRVTALQSLGRGLHSLQDMDAHLDMKTDDFNTPIATPHLFKGDMIWQYSDVDNPRYDAESTENVGEYRKVDTGSEFGSQRYSNTVKRTKEYLNKFYGAIDINQ